MISRMRDFCLTDSSGYLLKLERAGQGQSPRSKPNQKETHRNLSQVQSWEDFLSFSKSVL